MEANLIEVIRHIKSERALGLVEAKAIAENWLEQVRAIEPDPLEDIDLENEAAGETIAREMAEHDIDPEFTEVEDGEEES